MWELLSLAVLLWNHLDESVGALVDDGTCSYGITLCLR